MKKICQSLFGFLLIDGSCLSVAIYFLLAAPQKKTTESDVAEIKMEHSENSENSKILKRM
jgi:hypothetical protein